VIVEILEDFMTEPAEVFHLSRYDVTGNL